MMSSRNSIVRAARAAVLVGALSVAGVAFSLAVATAAPTVTLDVPPDDSSTRDTTPTFSGTAGNAPGDSDVTVKIYTGPEASGTPVQTLTAPRTETGWTVDASMALSDGLYTAQAEQTDAASEPGVSNANQFTVDTAAPTVALVAPADESLTNDAAPTFSGTAGDAPGDSGTVTVNVYSGPEVSGTPVQTLTAPRTGTSWTVGASVALPDGLYTAQAEQTDAVGNAGVSNANQLTVDTGPPNTSIVSGPAGLSNDSTPDFSFTNTEGGPLECSLRRAGEAAPLFAACGATYAPGPLADGAYVLEVRGIDAAGNTDASPASSSFEIDTTPPQTTIDAGPGDTTAATAAFLFSAPGAAGFSCRLDGGAWQPCGSPHTYPALSLGPHQFEVAAVDAAGNQDPTPAGHAWQVLRPGLLIPGAGQQAVALAKELVQMRRALAKVRLRTLARRRTVLFRTYDALTAGTVKVRARTRVRSGRVRRWVGVIAGAREVPGAGRHRVRGKVTKKGLGLVRRRRTLPLELRLSFTDRAGRALWATTKLTLKR